jgi:type I restriction enzyme S subunit
MFADHRHIAVNSTCVSTQVVAEDPQPMKKKATARPANAISRQSTLNFPTSSEADLVAESPAAETSTKSGAQNRRKRTADFADNGNAEPNAKQPNQFNVDSTVKIDAVSGQELLAHILQERRLQWQGRGQYKEPEGPDLSILPQLPAGWAWASLDQIAEVGTGTTPSRSNPRFWNNGEIPWLSSTCVNSEWVDASCEFVSSEALKETRLRSYPPGTLLMALYGEGKTRGKITELRISATVNQALAAIVLTRTANRCLPFVKHALRAMYTQLRREASGGVQPNLNLSIVKKVAIPLAPIPDQHRIVAEIEKQFTRLDAGVAALKRVQANLKRYRAAVLKAACEGKLVPTEAELRRAADHADIADKKRRLSASSAKSAVKTPSFETSEQLLQRILAQRRESWQGRGQYKEPFAPDTQNVEMVAEGWIWASVDQLVDETLIGLDRGRAQQSDDEASGIPYIKMNNVTMDGRVQCEKLVFVPASREEATRFAVQDGDILFNTRNSKELVGKVGLIRNPPIRAIYNNNLMRMRVPTGVLPEFLTLQMCSHEFRQRMELVKKATTSVAAIYAKDLLVLAIALAPLAEQTRIVAEVERRLSVVDELEAVVSANLQRAARLRQSILQKAFTGELTADGTCLRDSQASVERVV